MRESSMRCLGVIAPLLLGTLVLPAATTSRDGPGESQVGTEENAIYAAAIEQIYLRGKARRFLISDHTASFRCDGSPRNGLDVGGCSGMRIKEQTPKQALGQLRASLPGMLQSTVNDFELKNQTSFPLKDPLPLRVDHKLFGDGHPGEPPESWGTPDFAIYLSRVGFDREKNQALVYMAIISWTDARLSGGDYLLLSMKEKRWKVIAKKRVWQLQSE